MTRYRRTLTNRVVGRLSNGVCASRQVTVFLGVPWQPHRRHQSSGYMTRQVSTARSG